MVIDSPSSLIVHRLNHRRGLATPMSHAPGQLFMFGPHPAPRSPQATLPRLSEEQLRIIADPLDLNTQQLTVVTASLGPSLVLAGAGSGKTKVLTRRAAWLIGQGLHPNQILLITFTRKASAEMLHRVQGLNPYPHLKIQGGTFHSMAHTWLRQYGSALELSPRFTLMDEGDTSGMLHLLASKQRLTTLKGFPDKRTLLSLFGHAANNMTSVTNTLEETFPQYSPHTSAIVALHRLFYDTKWTQQRFDYDDLLLLTHRLFMEQTDAAACLSSQYHAILVDEYQDTTRLQAELVRLLGTPHRNVMVVGDDCQCLKHGTPVLTPHGEQRVETLKVGDQILSASGSGAITPCRIVQTSMSWPQEYLRITTQHGHSIEVSPQHICFAKANTASPGSYIYLMYREGLGFRIGITSITTNYRNSFLRTRQERADKFWFLKECASRDEAQYLEALWSLRYQIPQVLYEPEFRTASGKMTNTQATSFFVEFGTNGYRLLNDLGLNFEHPAYAPKASRSRNRIAINIIQCNSNYKRIQKKHPRHLLIAESRLGKDIAGKFENCTIKHNYWRIRLQSSDYRRLKFLAQELQYAFRQAGYNAVVIEKANFLAGAKHNTNLFLPMPASGLVTGMTIPILRDGKIITDKIKQIDRVPNSAHIPFHDLEVEDAHNVITNNIVTHNSIYSFRSADVRNMQEFTHIFQGTTLYKLEQNYRSSQPILTLANRLLEQAHDTHPKQLFTTRKTGPRPQLVQCPDDHIQSAYVIAQIRALQQQGVGLHRIAVLVRLSAHSYDLETALTHHRLPYVKYGGLALVETAHVKDFLAYLTVTIRPHDRLAWQRLLLLVDRIGPATAEELIRDMKQASDPLSILSNSTAHEDLRRLALLLRELGKDTTPLSLRLQRVLDHYQPYLKRHYPDDMTERMHELAYLVHCHKDIPNLSQLVEALVGTGTSDHTHTPEHPDDTIVISTIHSAKGLEWDAVFLVNAMDGRIPHSRSCSTPQALEEERRLLYVAITRPRHVLTITYPIHTTTYGTGSLGKCCRFLEPIPDTDLDRIMLS